MSHLLFTAYVVGFHWCGSGLLLLKDPSMGKYMMSLVLMLWWVVQLVTHA
jgi:hypothetical protein